MQDAKFRRNTRDGSSSKHDDEEACAFSAKERKGKGKKFHSKSESKGKKLDLSKVKCFKCHEHRHLATNYPQKKKKRKASGDSLASKFEFDFYLIACMVSNALGLVWYLDSGASFHMTGDKELFNYLEEKDLQIQIGRAHV